MPLVSAFDGISIRLYLLDNQHHRLPHFHASYRTGLNHCEATMYWDVKRVTPLSDYRIYVEISNGRKGIFDLKPYLDKGLFRELRDRAYFERVGIVAGAVSWPNEQDIAPDTLLAGLTDVDENETISRSASSR